MEIWFVENYGSKTQRWSHIAYDVLWKSNHKWSLLLTHHVCVDMLMVTCCLYCVLFQYAAQWFQIILITEVRPKRPEQRPNTTYRFSLVWNTITSVLLCIRENEYSRLQSRSLSPTKSHVLAYTHRISTHKETDPLAVSRSNRTSVTVNLTIRMMSVPVYDDRMRRWSGRCGQRN